MWWMKGPAKANLSTTLIFATLQDVTQLMIIYPNKRFGRFASSKTSDEWEIAVTSNHRQNSQTYAILPPLDYEYVWSLFIPIQVKSFGQLMC